MKRLLLSVVLSTILAAQLFAARQPAAAGRVLDEKGEPVEFATVILLQNGRQAAGTTTDTDGSFSLRVPAGDYTLRIQYIGYETLQQALHLTEEAALGDFVLRTSATEIEGVVVESQLIRREADRFVVDVANSPTAIGKDGAEMLQTAPGVWISDGQISINGKTGSKVYIDDRELKMESEQLLSYLRSLRAEDIRKIEVIPVSGADYDADSSAGIIKITLKRKRDDGIEGSLSYSTDQGEYTNTHNPYGNINYHQGRFDLYGSLWAWLGDESGSSEERTDYRATDMRMEASSELRNTYSNWGGRIGGIAEINPRHSIGAEFEYWRNGIEGETPSVTELSRNGASVFNNSIYLSDQKTDNYSVSFNYIVKLDTLGSSLKLLADYTRRTASQNSDNRTLQLDGGQTRDSLYFDRTDSRYKIFTSTLAWEKNFSPKWQLKAGAKYTRNDMKNGAVYRYLLDGAWVPSVVSDYRIDYTENIAAAYAVASAKLGRFGFVLGLRGEYTHTEGKAGGVEQNYFSLFPNANLSWTMDKKGKHSLIASYSRTIERPGFWSLTPSRQQISDYTYQTGNPSLEPAYHHSMNLSLVLCYKYTLTLGADITTDGIQMLMDTDPNDPRKIVLTTRNFPNTSNYYAALTLPVQLTKWWAWNTNATFIRIGQRIDPDSPLDYMNAFQCYTAMTFQLPAKFTFEASYFGQTTLRVGNMELRPRHDLNFSLKKRFLKERLVASFDVKGVLDRPSLFVTDQEGFTRRLNVHQNWGGRTFQLRLTYNFRSGKNFRSRSVESGSAEEKGRL